MEVDRVKYQNRRSEGWARIFAEFPKFGSLKLQKLIVWVKDPECRYAWTLKLDTKLQRWVHELAKNTTNLDMLGVIFDLSIRGEMNPNENAKDEKPTEELLWGFRAPKNVEEGWR